VSENKVLRRMFGRKREGGTESWRELHNEEFDNSYSWPDIIKVMKSRRMI
jgi:hypothetical protein